MTVINSLIRHTTKTIAPASIMIGTAVIQVSVTLM